MGTKKSFNYPINPPLEKKGETQAAKVFAQVLFFKDFDLRGDIL